MNQRKSLILGRESLLFKLGVCFVSCLLMGFVMNQYRLSMPVYTGLLAVIFAVFAVFYYLAAKKYKERTAFFRLIFIDCLLFFVLYVLFYEIIYLVPEYSIIWQLIIVVVSALSVVFNITYVIFNHKRGKISGSETAILVLILGFLFRALYALFNPISNVSRQHDTIAFTAGGGHLGYIWYIWAYGKIPDVDPRTLWEFYQPPLYYVLCAIWVKLFTMCKVPLIEAAENIQLFSLFFVTGTGIVLDAIVKRLTGNNLYRIVTALSFTLCPLFTFLAGSVNNDAVLIFLFMLSIYEAIVWYETSSKFRLFLLALFTGLTVMTKISGALIAVPLLVLFVGKLIKERDVRLIPQYCIFGIISLPIGLWWNVRNAILFNMPFVYFHEASKTSVQYIPDYLPWERLLDFRNQMNHLYVEIFNTSERVDHNIFVSTLKTMVFESSANVVSSRTSLILGWILMILSIGIILGSVVMMIYNVAVARKNREERVKGIDPVYTVMMLSIIVSQVIFYLYFNFAHTFVHNMHSRYIMPAILMWIILASLSFKDLSQNDTNRKAIGKKIGMGITCLYSCCLVSYIFLTAIMCQFD